MKHPLDRRSFLKTTGLLTAGFSLAGLRSFAAPTAPARSATPAADQLGWRLGICTYTFRNFSLYESIEKTAALGLRYLGAYPSQRLDAAQPDLIVGETLPAAARRELKRRLDAAGVKMVHFGVCGFDQGRDRFRAVFDLAAEFGVEAIPTEPPEDAFDALEKLADEYRIDLAIHNHPEFQKGSRYWNPDIVLKICSGRSKRIGACADTGHWARTGLNPIECLRKLEGRLLAVHLKDVDKLERKGHCVPYGTGVCDVKGMLAEFHRQGAKPAFVVEHEYNWADNLAEIAQSAAYFDATVAALPAGSA